MASWERMSYERSGSSTSALSGANESAISLGHVPGVKGMTMFGIELNRTASGSTVGSIGSTIIVPAGKTAVILSFQALIIGASGIIELKHDSSYTVRAKIPDSVPYNRNFIGYLAQSGDRLFVYFRDLSNPGVDVSVDINYLLVDNDLVTP